MKGHSCLPALALAVVAPFAAEAAGVAGQPAVERSEERVEAEELPIKPGRPSRRESQYRREGRFVTTDDEIGVSDALDEMLDELAADIARVGALRVSPVLIDRVTLSENLDPNFALALESRLVAAVNRAANVKVMRCAECWSTRGRVEDGTLVVSRGISRRSEMKRLAGEYAAQTFLSARLTLEGESEALALDVEVVRADNASVSFAEAYRFVAGSAMLYRGADSAQAREEKLRDLEQRIDRQPLYGHAIYGGALMIPASGNGISEVRGGVGLYRLYEKFGVRRQFRAGFNIGAFVADKELAAAILQAALAWRVTDENIYTPSLHLGLAGGAFMTGDAGNTTIGSMTAELLMVNRVAFQLGLTYMKRFDVKSKGRFGGWCPGGGVVVSW